MICHYVSVVKGEYSAAKLRIFISEVKNNLDLAAFVISKKNVNEA
jgi:hypothetical protein